MKNIKIVFLAAVSLLFGYACEDDKEYKSINMENVTPASILTPTLGSSHELLAAEGTTDFESFTWSPADFGQIIPQKYSLQIDQEGNNFANALELSNTLDLEYTIKVADLNLKLWDFGITSGAAENFEIRVITTVNKPIVDTSYISEIVNVTIKPFAYNKPDITSPVDGSSFILEFDSTGTVDWETITWDAVNYGSSYSVNYMLQFDKADSNFVKAVTLVNTSKLSYIPKVKDFNEALLKRGLEPGTAEPLEFRVIASIGGISGVVNSNLSTLTITPFAAEITSDEVPVIYMLGGGTSAGWSNNTANIVAYYQPSSGADSTFTAVDKLTPSGVSGSDGLIKFVRFIGMWAPQWGTDATGTNTAGPLVYRPTEAVADPTAIPGPAEAGDYLVTANIVSLTYKIEKVAETLHLIGDATTAVWDNTKAIPLTKDAPGVFSIETTLSSTATEGFKFLVNQGAWEPMYGQDGKGTWEKGTLTYRPVGAPDVKSIPPPPTTGTYLIEVNFAKNTYSLTKK